MKYDFAKVMAKRTNTELIEILIKNRNEYLPEAIEAAEMEFEKRKLTDDQIESAKQEIAIRELSVQEKANIPLRTGLKLLTFFNPGIFNFLIAKAFKAEGYERQWKEACLWTVYGFGFYIILFLIWILYKRFWDS